eukprot:CAMPEP_0194486630 /NCGR_PEP_ID=MMETSP0253-20130528/7206_1 /TAXON_ID=2966 /ORGANISM="Noctiluca scintillans" /LENGTH=123 /DNA_ID=CAMNT_0039326741 /DNA_START=129 /DNA_END=501 /DNA_ORIENTATION=+
MSMHPCADELTLEARRSTNHSKAIDTSAPITNRSLDSPSSPGGGDDPVLGSLNLAKRLCRSHAVKLYGRRRTGDDQGHQGYAGERSLDLRGSEHGIGVFNIRLLAKDTSPLLLLQFPSLSPRT